MRRRCCRRRSSSRPTAQVVTGREAQRQARLDPTRYEANPKRRIDDGEVLLGDRVVHVIDLIAAVLRTVGTEVRRQLGGAAPDQVRLTHPAQWGATRQNTLVTAARAAGLGTHLVLIPEPVAAAAQFTQLPGRALPPGGTVAIYDLGGGTFDIAVVGRHPGQRAPRRRSSMCWPKPAWPTSAGWTSTRPFSTTSAGPPPPPTPGGGSRSCAPGTPPGGGPPARSPRTSGPPRRPCPATRRPRSRCRIRSPTPT